MRPPHILAFGYALGLLYGFRNYRLTLNKHHNIKVVDEVLPWVGLLNIGIAMRHIFVGHITIGKARSRYFLYDAASAAFAFGFLALSSLESSTETKAKIILGNAIYLMGTMLSRFADYAREGPKSGMSLTVGIILVTINLMLMQVSISALYM